VLGADLLETDMMLGLRDGGIGRLVTQHHAAKLVGIAAGQLDAEPAQPPEPRGRLGARVPHPPENRLVYVVLSISRGASASPHGGPFACNTPPTQNLSA